MKVPEKYQKAGFTMTNLGLVVALHLGLAAAFVGCARQAEILPRDYAPVEAKLIEEVSIEQPPAPPPPMQQQPLSSIIYNETGVMPMASQRPGSLPGGPDGGLEAGTAMFPEQGANRSALVAEQPVSTFSIDVDTASYSFVRRSLTEGAMPPVQAVRVEEMINYFPYQYTAPTTREQPIAVVTEVMPSPWKSGNQLVHIAIKGYEMPAAQRPPINTVLLIDISGSMGSLDRLPLLQQGFRLFAEQLRDNDRVSIVTYATGTAVLLEPTAGNQKHKILEAIASLGAGGGTAGGEGLERAYAMAQKNFDPQSVNRVILATDGDFNLGISDPTQLEAFIAAKRKSGVYLSILGVGADNLNDRLIQRLAQAGNGNASFIDTLPEARKALSGDLGSNMFPIANDVKVQVEFNPDVVAMYRLVGYETRMLARQDFKDDRVDAGDMGAGHAVTAIYEITPADAASELPDPLRYAKAQQARGAVPTAARSKDEVCFVKLRYKLPGESTSRLMEHVVHASAARKSIDAVPAEQRFAVAVAAFGQRVRGEKELGDFSYRQIASLAEASRGVDPQGYRSEFVKLVRTADRLAP
jgi:Ca-activated chloride channel family protein